MFVTYQIGEVRDARDVLVGDELEGDAGKHEREAELEAILRQLDVHREGGERQSADQKLKQPEVWRYYVIIQLSTQSRDTSRQLS